MNGGVVYCLVYSGVGLGGGGFHCGLVPSEFGGDSIFENFDGGILFYRLVIKSDLESKSKSVIFSLPDL